MRTILSVAAIACVMAIAAPATADEPEATPEPTPENSKTERKDGDTFVINPPQRPVKEPIGTQRLLGAAAGALGFLTTAVGGFLVISSLNIYNEAEDRCKSRGCSTSDVKDGEKSRSRANIGGIVLVSGIAVLGGGIALWFTAPKAGEKKSDTQVGLAPSLGGLSAIGTF